MMTLDEGEVKTRSKIGIGTNLHYECSRHPAKARDQLVHVIHSIDLLVSQKFLRARSKDRHNVRTVDDSFDCLVQERYRQFLKSSALYVGS